MRILDVREVCSFADYFVIATAQSDRHARTLAEAAADAMRERAERPLSIEGQRTGRWILIDLGDVIMHVFQQETRDFYALEKLWGEAESVDLPRVAGGVG